MSTILAEERRLTETELAELWQLNPVTLRKWRASGEGPGFIKLGRAVRYRMADINAYEERGAA